MDKNNRSDSDRLLLSTRFVLMIGFGGLLAIMALASIDALQVLQQIKRNQYRNRQELVLKSNLLNQIRSNLYLTGTYVRDYLLDPAAGPAEPHWPRVVNVRHELDAALKSYQSHLEPEETEQFEELNKQMLQYWDVLRPVFEWSEKDRDLRGYAFLREQMRPRRIAMLQITDQIAAISEQITSAQNEQVLALLSQFQLRLAITLSATLILGMGMAALSIKKILRLEAAAHVQYQEVVAARTQLKELSASLVHMQETERRALSRELHDEVGQSLFAVLVELCNLSADLMANAKEQSRRRLDDIKRLVEGAVRVVRDMSLLLRPAMLDDLGLIPALRWQAREISKRTSMDVQVVTELASDEFPDEYKTCVYRVVQEALHNCSSHSHATTVRVKVRQAGQRLLLSIEDDGQGFDIRKSKGLGLLGIEERVATLAGTFEVFSIPGKGTTLNVILPLTHIRSQQAEESRESDSHTVSRRS